jgi:hypothetical protein
VGTGSFLGIKQLWLGADPSSHPPSKHQGDKWVGAVPLPSPCACNVVSWGDLYCSVGSMPFTVLLAVCPLLFCLQYAHYCSVGSMPFTVLLAGCPLLFCWQHVLYCSVCSMPFTVLLAVCPLLFCWRYALYSQATNVFGNHQRFD